MTSLTNIFKKLLGGKLDEKIMRNILNLLNSCIILFRILNVNIANNYLKYNSIKSHLVISIVFYDWRRLVT